MTAVSGSGIRSMSDSWISWNPRIDEPSKPSPSSKTSSVSSCAGIEKCCIRPGRSQNRTSTISTPSSLTSFRTSPGVATAHTSWVSRSGRERLLPTHEAWATSRSRIGCRLLGLRQRAADRLGDQPGHDVRVHVGVRPPVLDVALLVDLDLPRDAHRRTAVGHAVAELGPRRGLVAAGQPVLDVGAVARRRAPPRSSRAPRTPR